MGKKVAYTALVIVCIGVGIIIGGLGVYFLKPHFSGPPLITAREASCRPRMNGGGEFIRGLITFSQSRNSDLIIKVNITGLPKGKHGFHIHTYGVIGDNCATAGGHFNPRNNSHGGPESTERHVGDLGNLNVTAFLLENVVINDPQATLFGDNSIMGRSMVIHKKEDDLKNQASAGGRLACCTIQKQE